MAITVHSYSRDSDFDRIGQLLIRTASLSPPPINWLQTRWEYMHFHPYLDEAALGRIGVWEADGAIVGVAHYEDRLGNVFFELDPAFGSLKPEMITYAEANLTAPLKNGRKRIRMFLNDFDSEFEELAAARGYRQDIDRGEHTSTYDLTTSQPTVTVPDGFKLISLAENNDLEKIHRVLHRGFNHAGEPPPDELDSRRLMQSAPNFRKDLTLVAVAPDGDFVSFCGMWYDGENQIACVEPVATDPDYRFLGLGKAVVLEGLRRCGELGAKTAYVGSGQAFYLSIGFRKQFAAYPWVKYLEQ